jgi:hypothetical protein
MCVVCPGVWLRVRVCTFGCCHKRQTTASAEPGTDKQCKALTLYFEFVCRALKLARDRRQVAAWLMAAARAPNQHITILNVTASVYTTQTSIICHLCLFLCSSCGSLQRFGLTAMSLGRLAWD